MWRTTLLMMVTAAVPGVAMADSVVATRTIPAKTVVKADDVTLVNATIPNAITHTEGAVGLETRIAIYAGRPVRTADLGAPILVDRNQVVSLAYQSGGLAILTEGRALASGGVDDVIRVMNLASHNTVSGRISADGTVFVGPNF